MFIAPKNIPAMHAKRTPVTGSLRQREGARLGTKHVGGAGQGRGHARELLEGGPTRPSSIATRAAQATRSISDDRAM
jgi:hypothetical protein